MEATCEVKKSTHKVEVVPLVLEKHPAADRLSVVHIWGFTCVVATESWEGQTKAAYCPPDSLVDVRRDEFAFLAKDAKADGKARIKAKKLRGVLSFGLLVPAPEGSKIGDDVTELLGVEHFEPELRSANRGGLVTGGEAAKAPDVYCVKYDLESGRRYAAQLFEPGEPVVISEKVHGSNSRYVYSENRMNCGSRTEWKKEFPDYSHVTVESLEVKVGRERAEEIVAKLREKKPQRNMWWQVLDKTPSIRAFCEANPEVVLYGEVYGSVQDLNYGHTKGDVSFVAFDMMENGAWLDYDRFREAADQFGIPTVPILYEGPYDFDTACGLAEGQSVMPGANHVREGCVVRTRTERYDLRLGRAVLKWVGAGYLERSKQACQDELEWLKSLDN